MGGEKRLNKKFMAREQIEMFPGLPRTRRRKIGPVILREKIEELEAADKLKKEKDAEIKKTKYK